MLNILYSELVALSELLLPYYEIRRIKLNCISVGSNDYDINEVLFDILADEIIVYIWRIINHNTMSNISSEIYS